MSNSILKKIQKLAAKAESAKELGNLAEATAFSAKVSEMLTINNLAMSDINIEDESEVDGYFVNDLGLSTKQGKWTVNLLTVLSEHNYCSVVYQQTGKSDYAATIIGQPENVEVVKYLYSVLKRQFETIAKQEWKSYLEKTRKELQELYPSESPVLIQEPALFKKPWKYFKGVSSRSKYLSSFFRGAVIGVQLKLDEQRKEAENIHGAKITDMIIIKDADVQAWKEKEFPNLTKMRTRKISVNGEAYNTGIKTGKNASMAKGIANGQSVATTMLN